MHIPKPLGAFLVCAYLFAKTAIEALALFAFLASLCVALGLVHLSVWGHL